MSYFEPISSPLSFGYSVGGFINVFEKSLGNDRDLVVQRLAEHGHELNIHGSRSEEFTKNHDGMHILFGGCSVTFGVGLEMSETWAWKVYNSLKKHNKVSGFFNISTIGSSIATNIIKLFKYFNEFGNPDIIFLNLPNSERFLSVANNVAKNKLDIRGSIIQLGDDNLLEISEDTMLFINAITFELYHMLEAYCKQAGIKLISFTWTKENKKNKRRFNTKTLLSNFSTFYDIESMDNFSEYAFRCMQGEVEDLSGTDPAIFMVARDGMHPGIIENLYFKDMALKILSKIEDRIIYE